MSTTRSNAPAPPWVGYPVDGAGLSASSGTVDDSGNGLRVMIVSPMAALLAAAATSSNSARSRCKKELAVFDEVPGKEKQV